MTANAIRSYKDLIVWQKAIVLVEDCFATTANFPKGELYGLTSQMRRASVSIPSNIAEGFGRDQTGYFIQFLRVSMGSARELETQVIIAERVKFIEPDAASRLGTKCEEISKMLRALVRSLEENK